MALHTEVRFQTHEPCISDIDAVEKGEQEEEGEDRDDVEVEFPEEGPLGDGIGRERGVRRGLDVLEVLLRHLAFLGVGGW